MNTRITSHPRTTLAAALSVAMMFAAGSASAQETELDHDRTAAMESDSHQPMSDTWITTKVKSSLLADSDVAGLDVKVETVNGEVRLSGSVDSQAQIERATQIARDIEGVTSVDASGLTTAAAGDTDY